MGQDAFTHWNTVYTSKSDAQVSWTEDVPAVSLQLMAAAGLSPRSCVIDVGGGNSRLVDVLLDRGLTCVAVLDVAQAAIDRVRDRLGDRADIPTWIAGDVTAPWTSAPVDIWHDRAVFHFLTTADARAVYRARLEATLKPGGAAIIATFAADGPERCSGLPVRRYAPPALAAEFDGVLTLVESVAHLHHTPWGATQSFQYSRFVRQ